MASLFTHPPKILLPGEGQAIGNRAMNAQNYADRLVPLQTPQAGNQNISAAESARNRRNLLAAGSMAGVGAMVVPSTPAYGQTGDPFEAAAARVKQAAIHGRDPSQPRSGLADYAERMGNQAWGDIQDIAQHPENIVGTGELGMAAAPIKDIMQTILERGISGNPMRRSSAFVTPPDAKQMTNFDRWRMNTRGLKSVKAADWRADMDEMARQLAAEYEERRKNFSFFKGTKE